MVLFNYAIREVTAKIVYYGPGLCGKTTNLRFIHEKLDPGTCGKLLSLATDGDRTLFFDFLPIEMGSIGGYKVRFQLYTVPGQVHYNATRKLVLKGVDAVAFVADSQLSMIERNRESFENLIENLIENGYDPAKVPVVIQLNKRDLPNVASVGDLVAVMGVEGYPVVEAVASRGDGVFETLKTIVKLTLLRLRTQFDTDEAKGADGREAHPPPPSPPPPPPPSVVFAPAPPPPPPPPEVQIADSEITIEGLDEFNLDDFTEQAAAPPAAGDTDVARQEEVQEAEMLDLETDMAILTDEQLEVEEAWPDTGTPVGNGTGIDFETGIGLDAGTGPVAMQVSEEIGIAPATADEDEWFRETPPDAAFAPVAETVASEPPPWAVAMMEDLQRLRAENKDLRAALRGIQTLLDRQIGVLRDGREELGRHIGGDPGKKAS